jgi:hypothetical protein
VLVSNTGGGNLNLGAISITGDAQADYTDTGSCSAGLVLAPGASCVLYIAFDPTAAGTRGAILNIGSTSVALTGTGSAAAPLPLWSYALLGALLLLIATRRRQNHFPSQYS